MQNFTFGRKGTNWFLFAFLLLIGTLPSFGQDCATVTDEDSGESGNQQTFCYLSTIEDIDRTGTNTAIFESADTDNDTQPIASDELLTDGTTYFVGSTTEDCDRVAVDVTVNAVNTPDNSLYPGQNSFTLSPCVSSDFSVGDLEALFTADAGANYSIEAYTSEFGDEVATGNLVPGESYFVGQISSTQGECPSPRAAVGYDPTNAPAPVAQAAQTFCEGATVADLVASGTEDNTQTIRWYRSATSNSPLADDVELINGEDYYASQIVNDRNDPFPPCETSAAARAQVIVTLNEPIENNPISIEICTTQILPNPTPQSFEEFYRGLLGNVEGGSFSPSFQTLVNQYNNNSIGIFTTTFTSDEGCESTEVSVETLATQDAEAGGFEDITLTCATAENFILENLQNTQDDATEGGTFSGIGVENNQFDVSVGPGTYEITYFVNDESGDCITPDTDDTTTFFITINEDFESIEDVYEVLCSDQIVNNPSLGGVRAYLNERVIARTDLPPGGTFTNNTPEEIFSQFQENRFQTFNTTYTATTDCGELSVNLIIEVVESGDANAGEISDINLSCNAEDIYTLNDDILDVNATLGGTFTAEDGVLNEDGNFDPSIGPGEYLITYSVDENSAPCITPGTQDSTDFTITVEASNQENNINETFCVSEIQTLIFSGQDFESILEDILGEDSIDTSGNFNQDLDILQQDLLSFIGDENILSETFGATYTTDCSVTNIEVTIIKDGPANAGEIEDQVVSCFTSDMIDLTDYLEGSGAQFGGTFTGPGVQGNMFDPSIGPNEDGYLITYTVSGENSECIEGSASSDFTIMINESIESNDDVYEVLCNDQIINNPTLGGTRAYLSERIAARTDLPPGGTFTNDTPEEIFSQFQENRFQTFNTTYTVSTTCGEASVNLIIEVIETGPAVAEAMDDEINLCISGSSYDLFTALSEDTTPGGSFTLNGEAFEGRIFDATTVESGDYFFTYTVSSEDADCIEGSASANFTINVSSDFDFGDEITDILCESEVSANLTAEIIEDYYLSLVEGLPSGGTFSTSPEEILAQYNTNPIGTFTTTYSVETGECQGSVEVSLTIQEEGDANAGNIENQVVCSTDGMIALTDFLVGSGARMGGTFTGDGVVEGMFDTNMEADDYEITYTVTDAAPCVTEGTEDLTTFIISIVEPGQAIANAMDAEIDLCTSETSYDLNDALSEDSTPGGTFFLEGEEFEGTTFDATSVEEGSYQFTYTVNSEVADCIDGEANASFTINITSEDFNAGEDVNLTACVDILDNDPTLVEVRNYFLNLLADGVPTNGTFSPSMEEIRGAYTADQIGTFTTTYTIGNGACEDSVELTVVVTDVIPAEVGEIADQTVCSSDEDLNLYDLITSGNEDGTFEGYENGIFSPSMMDAGTYEITYTVNEDTPCVEGEASTTFTIEVLQGANAGEDMDVSVCSNDGLQDLFSLISADADMDGEFTLDGEVITDGIMDPSAFEAGTYEVVYTVMAEDDQCGGDYAATITITLGEAPEAPTTGDAVAFCAIDGATAALLDAEGTNLTWYSDADLSMMVSEEDLLVNGEYYVTQSADNGCESEAAMIMVNIVDSPAPTISSDYELCAFDNPTLADLTAEINETGEVTWYESADSMTALSNNAMLTDGTTYYATLISDNGCESSERLAVTVTLEDCALLFPEAITPNGDGRNDRLVIENIESEYPNYNITIFNRWGNAVYKGNASTPTWDGTSNQSGSLGDDVLPVGVYFYVVDFNDGSTEPRQGKVYLNR